jgi:tetratricopeptide (TPR) repeat protein
MGKILDYLSGGIPGGAYILFFVLLAVQLTFMNLKKSALIGKKEGLKKQLIYSSVIIVIYIILWFSFKPPLPRIRVIVLPSKEGSTFKLNDKSIQFTELVERTALNNQGKKYLIHRLPWLYETIGKDSVLYYQSWLDCAKRMKPGVIIESSVDENGRLNCKVHILNNGEDKTLEFSGQPFEVLNNIDDKIDLFKDNIANLPEIQAQYLQAKLAYLGGHFAKVDSLLENSEDTYTVELRAAALVAKGRMMKIDRERAKYTKIVNPDLDKARKLLYSLIKKRRDMAETAFLLGRIAQWEEKFEDANTFLKKALSDDPYNSRIYYAISFLLSSRFKELGFERRDQILEKALYLDPGYRNAVLELAQHYYQSSSGSPSSAGIAKAMETIRRYLYIKPNDPMVLSALASILTKTKKLNEALTIYKELQKRFPNDSNSYYDIGTILFYKREYRQALNNFLQAIKINENLDSYLMAGFSYRELGINDSALYYYRERVRRKTGDDDIYAAEAMKGIRIILQEQEQGSKKEDVGSGKEEVRKKTDKK